MSANTTFDEWAVLELFGHQRIAGKVTEAQIGGGAFVRVDVPEIDDAKAITKYYNPSAIYSISPCTEETARRVAAHCRPQPVDRYDVMAEIQSKVAELRKNKALPTEEQEEFA